MLGETWPSAQRGHRPHLRHVEARGPSELGGTHSPRVTVADGSALGASEVPVGLLGPETNLKFR